MQPFTTVKRGEHFQETSKEITLLVREGTAHAPAITRITLNQFQKVVIGTTIIIYKPFVSNATQVKRAVNPAKSKK
jgi:hypothetical protein